MLGCMAVGNLISSEINVPADAHDILTVGAVSLDKVNAPFSSIGPTADGRIKPLHLA